METLVMICEDAARELDQEIHGIRLLRFMIPKFIQFYSNPDPQLRVQAINATSQFVLSKPRSFVLQLDSILDALYKRVSDPDPRVRHEFCRILALFLEAFPQKLGPYLDLTIDCMVKATTDPVDQVRLAACDFWMQYAHSESYRLELIDFLPLLVQNLVQLMVYSDSDLFDIGHLSVSMDKHPQHASLPFPEPIKTIHAAADDDDRSIRSCYYRPKDQSETNDAGSGRNSNELSDCEEEDDSDTMEDNKDNEQEVQDDDDDDFDDDEFYSEDSLSLRKCSAAALDALSESFGDDIATVIIDHLQNHTLINTDWLVRESGILALGAAAKGNTAGDTDI
jgi:transportin-1